MTGYVLAEDLRQLKEEGSLEVVQKPLDTDTLARVVRRALDGDEGSVRRPTRGLGQEAFAQQGGVQQGGAQQEGAQQEDVKEAGDGI